MTYPTLAQCKTMMGVTAATDDAILTQIVAGVIAQIEQHCNRVFVAANDTKYFPVKYPWISNDAYTLYLFKDLLSVTTLTNGDAVVITAANYDLQRDPPYHKIVLRKGKGYVWQSDGEETPISILGSWGYSATCPNDIFLTIMELVNLSYRSAQDGAGTQLTGSGYIIDKSKWPERIQNVLNAKRRP